MATGYTLAIATVIPLSGWAADRFGSKRVYLAAVALFMIGSALAGAAWSAESLIMFRVLQGLGGGLRGRGAVAHARGLIRSRGRWGARSRA